MSKKPLKILNFVCKNKLDFGISVLFCDMGRVKYTVPLIDAWFGYTH
jgi:hypothetical protein